MALLNVKRTPAQLFSKKFTHIKFSQLIIKDLDKLEEVHKKSLKESYLLNSYLMNLVASWQVFVQDLAEYAIDEMTSKNQDEKLNIILKNNLEEKLNRFNTPNSSNIDSLFKNIAGIGRITGCLEPIAERKLIDEVLQIRHSIAHTGYTSADLSISCNFERMETLMKAAKKMEEVVRNYVDS